MNAALHGINSIKGRHARRRELEDRLRTSRVGPPAPGRPLAGESHRYRSLSHNLVEMGSAFALFGRYLSTRIDMLPADLCAELAGIPDVAVATTPEEVRQIVIQELGCPPESAFLRFEPQPFESRRLWQAHHATLGGSPVVVRIMHPSVQAWIGDAEFLSILSRSLEDCGLRAAQFSDAADDFRRELLAAQTFEADLSASSLFEQDAQSFDIIGAPRAITHLCTPRVAVHELVTSLAGETAGPDPDLARTLCTAWLRQALQGRVYPVDPRIGNVAFSPEGRVVFIAGPFATLAERPKTHLWNYLIAVAAENTDEAYSHLSQETAAGRSGAVDEELRRCFRQTVAFRDALSRGMRSASGQSVADRRFTDEVLIHWRFTSERGPMEPGVISFYRGLFTLVNTARKIAPECDSLAEALFDLRVISTFGQAREMMRPSEIAALLESYATAFLGMPQQIERLLANAPAQGSGARRSGSHAALFSLLLAMGGIAMLFHKIGESAGGAPANRFLIFALIGAGLVLLWMGRKLT